MAKITVTAKTPAKHPLKDVDIMINDACIWYVFSSGTAIPIAGPFKSDKAALAAAGKTSEDVHRANTISAVSRVTTGKAPVLKGVAFTASKLCRKECIALEKALAKVATATTKPAKTKITQFDMRICATVRAEATAALQAVAKKYGVNIESVGGSYTPASFSFKVNVATIGSDGTANTPYKDDWFYATLQGFKESDLGRSFKHQGKTVTIVGWRPKAKKCPVVVKMDGKLYKYSAESVKLKLGIL